MSFVNSSGNRRSARLSGPPPVIRRSPRLSRYTAEERTAAGALLTMGRPAYTEEEREAAAALLLLRQTPPQDAPALIVLEIDVEGAVRVDGVLSPVPPSRWSGRLEELTAAEKWQREVDIVNIRNLLGRHELSVDLGERIRSATQVFQYILQNPSFIAMYPTFRRMIILKMAELEDQRETWAEQGGGAGLLLLFDALRSLVAKAPEHPRWRAE